MSTSGIFVITETYLPNMVFCFVQNEQRLATATVTVSTKKKNIATPLTITLKESKSAVRMKTSTPYC